MHFFAGSEDREVNFDEAFIFGDITKVIAYIPHFEQGVIWSFLAAKSQI
jgi:hypothetical protein